MQYLQALYDKCSFDEVKKRRIEAEYVTVFRKGKFSLSND
jgi:hypothetical protein